MPVQKLIVRPGINTEATSMLNESGWSLSQFVRFFQGYLQKLGGWVRLVSVPLLGTCRAMLSWQDASSNQYIILGTNSALEVYTAGALYNVTPIDSTDNPAVSFTTVLGQTTVKITDAASNAVAGNTINIVNPIAVGGLILRGPYVILSVVDANNYNITAASAATANVTNGGATAVFNTTNTSPTISVTLAAHGYQVGDIYTVYVSTTVATVVLNGAYNVASITDANHFTFTASSNANATTSGSENAGNVRIQYLLPSGGADSANQGGLFGAGAYGSGPYGIGGSAAFVPARIWSFGYWGTDVVASYTNGHVYVWLSENGLVNNPATDIANSPRNVAAGIFTAMPQQQVVALGASSGVSTDVDQMLVRWSDIADYTTWVATATNQAGSFRIPRGARIVGGIQGPQTALLWTDVGLWLMQYIGFPLVYGFTEIAQGCGLIWQNAKAVIGGKIYWMSYNGFFVYDGNSVQPVPCPVWDKVFQNLNTLQTAKVVACPNSFFNEISWCFPSANGTENDTRVTLNTQDGTWTFDPTGAITRTAWLDQSSLLNPLGVDGAGLIQQHESGNDADGSAMTCYAQTGFFKVADGLEFTFIERLIPDAILQNCTLQFTLYFQDYPGQAPSSVGPLSYTSAVNYLIVRGRGRLVSTKVGSSDLGSFWRLGEMLYFGSTAGRR